MQVITKDNQEFTVYNNKYELNAQQFSDEQKNQMDLIHTPLKKVLKMLLTI